MNRFVLVRDAVPVVRHVARKRWSDDQVFLAAIDVVLNMDVPRQSRPEDGAAVVAVRDDWTGQFLQAVSEKEGLRCESK